MRSRRPPVQHLSSDDFYGYLPRTDERTPIVKALTRQDKRDVRVEGLGKSALGTRASSVEFHLFARCARVRDGA